MKLLKFIAIGSLIAMGSIGAFSIATDWWFNNYVWFSHYKDIIGLFMMGFTATAFMGFAGLLINEIVRQLRK